MFKKSLFTLLVLFGFTLMAEKCFADVSAQLEQAEAYLESGNYEQAAAIYKSIVQDYPGSQYALEAQKGLTILYISWDKPQQAEAAFEQLLVDFSGHEQISAAACAVADIYRESHRHGEAKQLYQYVLDTWPDSDDAMWSQAGLVKSNIELGDDPNADAAIEKLLIDFSNHNDIAEALGDIAHSYCDVERYQKAREFYQYVLDNWPDSDDVMWSQTGLAMSNIELGDAPNADAAIEKLLTEFSDHNDIAQAIYNIADNYGVLQQYEKARQLHQYVLDNRLGTDAAMESQVGLAKLNAISDAKAGNDAAVDAAIKKLLTEFSGREETAGIVNVIGEQYLMLQRYERALQVYQYALAAWPDSENAIGSLSGVGASHAALGNDAAAKAALEKLLTAFSGDPELPEAALQIAEPYWDKAFREEDESQAKAYFRKAIRIYERVKSRIPGYVPDAETCGWTGLCYRRLGDYEKSIQCYQKVVDDYPQSPKAWYGLFMVARNYEHLKESGAISKPQADAKIKAAYQQLLERYPDCRVAGIAQQWLTR